MRAIPWILIVLITLALPISVLAGHSAADFDGVIGSIEQHYGIRSTRIPLQALAGFLAARASHGAVRQLRMAEFDHFHAVVDSDELNQIVAQKLGPGWERVVRETSRSGHAQTLIFGRPEGNRMGLFVLELDGHDLEAFQLSVDPDHLSESLDRFRRAHKQS